MITVRFPDGTSIQYNTANWVVRHPEYSDLQEKEGGRWIAQVPNSAVIEIVPACRVYNPTKDFTNDRISSLEKAVRSLTRKLSRGK